MGISASTLTSGSLVLVELDKEKMEEIPPEPQRLMGAVASSSGAAGSMLDVAHASAAELASDGLIGTFALSGGVNAAADHGKDEALDIDDLDAKNAAFTAFQAASKILCEHYGFTSEDIKAAIDNKDKKGKHAIALTDEDFIQLRDAKLTQVTGLVEIAGETIDLDDVEIDWDAEEGLLLKYDFTGTGRHEWIVPVSTTGMILVATTDLEHSLKRVLASGNGKHSYSRQASIKELKLERHICPSLVNLYADSAFQKHVKYITKYAQNIRNCEIKVEKAHSEDDLAEADGKLSAAAMEYNRVLSTSMLYFACKGEVFAHDSALNGPPTKIVTFGLAREPVINTQMEAGRVPSWMTEMTDAIEAHAAELGRNTVAIQDNRAESSALKIRQDATDGQVATLNSSIGMYDGRLKQLKVSDTLQEYTKDYSKAHGARHDGVVELMEVHEKYNVDLNPDVGLLIQSDARYDYHLATHDKQFMAQEEVNAATAQKHAKYEQFIANQQEVNAANAQEFELIWSTLKKAQKLDDEEVDVFEDCIQSEEGENVDPKRRLKF
ncbi:hypothetical protein MPSEU_000528700 [Mayamaea pseudoterrestris]|nr:hypothetical protein MPSEU_000528700 [Mayamaea pseudoterrestris]